MNPRSASACAEVVVRRLLSIDRVARQSVAPVLDDHHRATLARRDVLGHHEHAPGEHVGPHVEDDVPRGPSGGLGDLAAARVERQVRRVEYADAILDGIARDTPARLR